MSCKFCEKVDFGSYRAEVYEYGACISTKGGSGRFPPDEQFKYCPECGEKLNVPIRFNFKNFCDRKFVINVKTKEECDMFLAYLHGKGLRWSDDRHLLDRDLWSRHQEKTVIDGEGSKVGYCDTDWYKGCDIPVIPFNKNDLD